VALVTDISLGERLALRSSDSHSTRHGWPSWLLAAVALAGGVPAGAQVAPVRDPLASFCVVLGDALEQKPVEPSPASNEPRPPKGPAAPEVLQPPREHEIEELGRVLKALAGTKTSGPALAALGEGRPFTVERFAVLLADARSIVTQLHARELLAHFGESKDLAAETRQWIERTARTAEDCASSRFENRGGAPVHAQVLAVVGKHRGQLETLLFEGAQSQAPEPPPAARGAQAKPGAKRDSRP
jgi:hypothetical protein